MPKGTQERICYLRSANLRCTNREKQIAKPDLHADPKDYYCCRPHAGRAQGRHTSWHIRIPAHLNHAVVVCRTPPTPQTTSEMKRGGSTSDCGCHRLTSLYDQGGKRVETSVLSPDDVKTTARVDLTRAHIKNIL